MASGYEESADYGGPEPRPRRHRRNRDRHHLGRRGLWLVG